MGRRGGRAPHTGPEQPRPLPAGGRRPGGTPLLSAMEEPGAPGAKRARAGQDRGTAQENAHRAERQRLLRFGAIGVGRDRESRERSEGRYEVDSEGREEV